MAPQSSAAVAPKVHAERLSRCGDGGEAEARSARGPGGDWRHGGDAVPVDARAPRPAGVTLGRRTQRPLRRETPGRRLAAAPHHPERAEDRGGRRQRAGAARWRRRRWRISPETEGVEREMEAKARRREEEKTNVAIS